MSISGAVVNDPVWNAFRKCTWERMDDENRLKRVQPVFIVHPFPCALPEGIPYRIINHRATDAHR